MKQAREVATSWRFPAENVVRCTRQRPTWIQQFKRGRSPIETPHPSAGAMLFVIVNDVVPESHRHQNGTYASSALIGGFILMTFPDTATG